MLNRIRTRGVAIPVVVVCIVIVAILLMGLLQVSMQETKVLDKTFDHKMAFYTAEAGLNKAASLLISRPFYERWYLKEAGERAKGSKLAGVQFLMQPHRLPASFGNKYMDQGTFDVVVVERHKKFPTLAIPEDPKADGFDPRKVTPTDPKASELENRITNARVSHVDIFAKGTWEDPGTGQPSSVILYGKFVVLPEPYAFEYDTNGDHKISYYGAGTGKEADPGEIAHFKELGNDYMDHPFLDPEHWRQYSPPDLLSQKPILARVIKVRAISDPDLANRDLAAPETLALLKKRLADMNLQFLANFAQNRDVVETFRKMENDRTFSAAGDTATVGDLKRFLDVAGGIKPAPDVSNLTDQQRNDFLAYAIKHFRHDEEGPAYKDLEFNLQENPLGDIETPKAKALGQVFNLSALQLEQHVVDMLKKGDIKNGEQLLDEMHKMNTKPLSETGMPTHEYIRRLSAAIQEYAVVSYPMGRVIAQKFTADGIHKPPDPNVSEWYEYEITSEFEEKLLAGKVGDPNSFYNDMVGAKNEADKAPEVTPGNQKPTVDLSDKPPEKAENQIPILLVNKQDKRLTTKFSNVLDFYFKYIDFDIKSGDEDFLTAKPGDIYVDPGYASRWKCKCLTVSKVKNDHDTNTRPSASHSAIAVGGD